MKVTLFISRYDNIYCKLITAFFLFTRWKYRRKENLMLMAEVHNHLMVLLTDWVVERAASFR